MIRAGAGLSDLPASGEAARRAAADALAEARLERADLLFLFLTADHLPRFPDAARAAAEASGGARVVGCTGYGVLTSEGEIEGGPGAAALALGGDGIAAAPFLAEGLSGAPRECGRAIGRQARGTLGRAIEEGPPPLVILLPDTYNLRPRELFEGIHEGLGRRALIVGGGASENGSLGRTFQFLDGRVQNDAVAGAVLAGGQARFIGISQAYQPVGEPWMVTRAKGNLILEISGRPAFEVFAEAAGPELMENLRLAAAQVFVGIPGDPDQVSLDHGNYIVRPIVGADPAKGILALAEPVPVGQAVTFARRDRERALQDFEAMLQKGVDRFGRGNFDDAAAFGLYFNCAGRGSSLYGAQGVDAAAIRRAMFGLPVAGFFTGAEIGPIGGHDHLHQFSGVLVLLGEDPGVR